MSFDSPSENLAWALDEGFQYELWSDDARELALYYGAASSPNQLFADRKTFLLDANGDLLLEYPFVITGVHPGEVLADCELLFGP